MDEGVVGCDADLSVVDFGVDSVFVEDGADFWLLEDEADDGVEVFDGFHCFGPFCVVSIFLIDAFIISWMACHTNATRRSGNHSGKISKQSAALIRCLYSLRGCLKPFSHIMMMVELDTWISLASSAWVYPYRFRQYLSRCMLVVCVLMRR